MRLVACFFLLLSSRFSLVGRGRSSSIPGRFYGGGHVGLLLAIQLVWTLALDDAMTDAGLALVGYAGISSVIGL